MKKAFMAMILFLLSGCATQRVDMTRAEWLNMINRTYQNTSVNDVLSAGEQVLRLSDSTEDISIYHLPDRMVGLRRYTLYAVLYAEYGSYNYELQAVQSGQDVKTSLLITKQVSPIMPMPAYTPAASGGSLNGMGVAVVPGFGQTGLPPINAKEVYDLYFSRLESVLRGSEWVTCSEIQLKKADGDYSALCTFADDNIPESGAGKAAKMRKAEAEKLLIKDKPAKQSFNTQ